MKQADYMLITRAIENCEDREKRLCEEYSKLHPEDRKRIEANRDMFLFAAMMIRNEIDRMIKENRRVTA